MTPGVEAGKPIRLLLVDDSDVYRSTMELVLGREASLQVVASVAAAEAAVRVCDEVAVDLVLLDFRLPGADGTSVTTAIRAGHPDVAVVCLTAEAAPHERAAVLAAGAAAVVEKGDLAALLLAIRSAVPAS